MPPLEGLKGASYAHPVGEQAAEYLQLVQQAESGRLQAYGVRDLDDDGVGVRTVIFAPRKVSEARVLAAWEKEMDEMYVTTPITPEEARDRIAQTEKIQQQQREQREEAARRREAAEQAGLERLQDTPKRPGFVNRFLGKLSIGADELWT